jgi:pyrroloquinoline quinone (PQQ) biosynthesis protein C
LTDERAIAFFRVHESIDVLHQQIEMQILREHCLTPEDQIGAISAATASAQALWSFLDGITAEYFNTQAEASNSGGAKPA